MTDRELDARIAVEVMGFERIEDRPGYGLMYWKRIDTSHAPAGWYDEHYPVPFYSTDIGVAMGEVVERIKVSGFATMEGFIEALRNSFNFIISDVSSDWIFYLTPQIICLAALEAVKAKVPT